MPKTDESRVELSTSDIKELLKTVLEEARKPVVDEQAQKRKEMHRQRLRNQMVVNEHMRALREARCSHMRQDNTSRIAWMQNSDGVVRGTCQYCHAIFEPGHKDYDELIRRPTYGTGVVYI